MNGAVPQIKRWNQKALNWSCQTVAVQSKKIVKLRDEIGFIMLLLLK